MLAVSNRRLLAAAAAAALAVGLVACQGDDKVGSTEPSASATSTAPRPTSTPTPTVKPPALVPDGTAAENLPYFAQVVDAYVGAYGRGERVVLLDHLRAAGFDPTSIEAGWATTPSGLQEMSIEAAVRFGDACVIATVRDDRSTAIVAPLLSTERCLIGDGFSSTG